MAADIRSTSLDVLGWLLSTAGDETVGSAGGWVKTMKCFLSVLGWNMDDSSHQYVYWSSNGTSQWAMTSKS